MEVQVDTTLTPEDIQTASRSIEVTSEIVNATNVPFMDVNGGIATKVIAYIIFGIFGILANGFSAVIIVMTKKMREKVNNFFILNQSIIDFLGSLFLIVNNPVIVSQKQPASWFLAQLYCRFWASSYFMWAMFEMSTFNLIAITVERYAEVVHPLSYHIAFNHRKAYQVIAFVWISGILFPAIPNVIPSTPGSDGICFYHGGWPNEVARKVAGIIVYIVLMVFPLIVMIFCYTRMVIVFKVRINRSLDSNMSTAEKVREQRRMKAKKNLTKTLMIVCGAFFICWILNLTYIFLADLGLDLSFSNTFYNLTVYLSFMNCVVNPVIYTAQYREFQTAVKTKLQCLLHQPEEIQSDTTTSA